jgi:hypothetical protein
LAQLKALNEAAMRGGDPAVYARGYGLLALPGAPPAENTGLYSLLRSMRQHLARSMIWLSCVVDWISANSTARAAGRIMSVNKMTAASMPRWEAARPTFSSRGGVFQGDEGWTLAVVDPRVPVEESHERVVALGG